MSETPTYLVKIYKSPFPAASHPNDHLTASEIHKYVCTVTHQHLCSWGIPMSEIDRICSEPSFPLGYMIDIRCAMLFCLANTMAGSGMLNEDEFVMAEHCFAALVDNRNDTSVRARRRFLEVFIDDLTRDHLWKNFGNGVSIYRSSRYPSGYVFEDFVHGWKEAVIDTYLCTSALIDFKSLRQTLTADFGQKLKKVMSTPRYRNSHEVQRHREASLINNMELAAAARKCGHATGSCH